MTYKHLDKTRLGGFCFIYHFRHNNALRLSYICIKELYYLQLTKETT